MINLGRTIFKIKDEDGYHYPIKEIRMGYEWDELVITVEDFKQPTTLKEANMSMNYSTAVFLINPEVRAVRVTYEKDTEKSPATTYLYKTFNKDIKVGDYVVVPTNSRHNMTVCKVSEVDVEIDFDSSIQVKWIIDVVNNSSFKEVLTWEDEAANKIKIAQAHKKREDLRKVLEDSVNGALSEIKALPISVKEV